MTFVTSSLWADVMIKRRGMVTYLQVLEMNGRQGPQQPRQRALINLVAIRPDTQPLNDTLRVGDVSQNPLSVICSLGATPRYSRVRTRECSKSARHFAHDIWRR